MSQPDANTGRLWLDANGNGTYDDGEALTVGGTFTRQDLLDGKVRYTHLGNEVFEDSFRVRAVEPGPGLESGDAVVSVFIRPANEARGRSGSFRASTLMGGSSTSMGVSQVGSISAVRGGTLSSRSPPSCAARPDAHRSHAASAGAHRPRVSCRPRP